MIVLVLLNTPAYAATTAIINVNVLPMSSADVIPAQTVLVEDDRIIALGNVDSIRIPDDAFVVDGTDRFLMPGLAEMHAHVPASTSDNLDRYFNLFVANGVTSIRGMLGDPSHLGLRQQIIAGEVFGPRLVTSGPSLNGRSVSGPQDARRQVREQADAGYDFIKIHPGLSRDEFIALAEAANDIGIPFAGHVTVAAGLEAALELKMATIDHLDGYFVALLPSDSPGSGGYGGFFDVMLAEELDAGNIERIALLTAAAGTWNVPTQTLIENRISSVLTNDLMNWPEMRYVRESTVQRWAESREALLAESGFNPDTAARAIELRRQLIRALHHAGAKLLLGSDAPQVFNVPGFSLHRELQVLVAAGLTPYEALRTGTVAAAEFLGTNAGVIAVGKEADLLLLNANPLDDIENSQRIHGVMLRGQWLSRRALDERLERFASQ
ncbi:MAG: amidohydrolase family protein [Gammaproteobacteria bacterium]|nr:amidohydrolase family protein [Gammaproteobacteria bacterium]